MKEEIDYKRKFFELVRKTTIQNTYVRQVEAELDAAKAHIADKDDCLNFIFDRIASEEMPSVHQIIECENSIKKCLRKTHIQSLASIKAQAINDMLEDHTMRVTADDGDTYMWCQVMSDYAAKIGGGE